MQTLTYVEEPLKPRKHILLGETTTHVEPYDCSIEWPYNSVGTGQTPDCLGYKPGPFPRRNCYEVITPILTPPMLPICIPPCYTVDWHHLPPLRVPCCTILTPPGCSTYDEIMDLRFRQGGLGARWRYFDLKGVRAHRTKNVLFVDANVRPPPRPPIDLCGRDPTCDPTVFSLPPCREGIPCQDKWPREDYKEYVDYDLDFTN